VSHGADGKTRVIASIPGTGISYQETVDGNKKKETKRKSRPPVKKEFNKDELLYSFHGVLRLIREDGKMLYDDFNRHYYTVSFY
jgi:hypothetical protein